MTVKIRRAYLFAALTATTVAVACTLNPQPLPPEEAAPADGGVRGDGGVPTFDPPPASNDGAAPMPDGGGPNMEPDAGSHDGDADGGDGGLDGGAEDGG